MKYRCRYKHNNFLQDYIFKKHNQGWSQYGQNILDINKYRERNLGKLFKKDDYLIIYINYDYLSFGNWYNDKDYIDFEKLLRKEKFERLLK